MPLAHYDMECGPKCRSRRHAQDLNASITKGTLREIQAYFRLCHNAGHVTDTFHRTPLHLAASCGKIDVVDWLLTSKKSELTIRDEESGWTALHRALFYGQLAVARRLLHEVTDLTVRDREGLGPLDIIMKDRPGHVTFSLHDPNEVYSWGDNSNLTLGHSVEQRRSLPEPVDTFRRLQLNVKQVVLNKYHTVFLTSCGKVLTCGHGQGGRLGHNDEQPCLVPRVVEALQKQICTQIAAARDHTVFLMEGGLVYTCGLNDCHQLGQFPLPPKSLFPKPVNAKVLKGKKVMGICAGRFHTGVMTSVPGSPDAVYTFGLNAGQLGHAKGDKFQSQPRLVAALNYEGLTIQKLSGSDAAIVCMTSTGDIFVCHEYQCRKITSKWQETVKIEVSGGRLDYSSDRDMLREYGGTELIIALLSCTGQVFVWKEKSPVITRCHWAIRRNLQVTDMSLSSQNIIIVTHEGEGLIGHFTGRRRTTSQHVKTDSAEGGNFENQTLMDLLLKDPTEEVHVTRVPHIYRATSVTTDRKGRNYVITQTTPISSLTDVPCVSSSTMARDLRTLLEEADQMDVIHDVVLKAGHIVFPAHKYILAYRSEYFRKHFESETADTEEQITEIHLDDDVHPVIFKQLLNFIYTDTCDLMQIGARFELPSVQYLDSTGDIFDFEPHVDFEMKSGQHKSASHKPQASQKGKSKHKKKNGVKVKVNEMGDGQKKSQNGKTPVKMLLDLAKKFSVKGLSKRLEAVKYVDGGIQSTGKSLPRPSITFDRTKLPFLYDVSIRGDSGEVVRCHKAIAVARLEYFHSMMASGWMETSNTASLSLPIQGDVLVTVLDFLYSGDAPEVRGCVDTERLCDVLVVADQLLITPLKEMCEVALATLLTLKNAGDMLEFASMYNAGQLRATCQQYISLNLAAILEARGLDVLSDDVMSELTEYYKNMIPGMCRRVITPYDEGPDRDYLGGLAAEFLGEDEDFTAGETAKRKQKAKKRRTQRKSVSEVSTTVPTTIQKERPQSISSEISVKSEEDETDLLSVTPEDRNTKIMASTIPTVNGRDVHQSRAWPDLVSPPAFTSRIPTTAAPPSPGSEVNLRGIISQEVAASKHTDGQKPSNVTPKKSSKMSQKERKRLATAQNQRSPQPQQSPSHAPCPWGGAASSGHAPWSSSVSQVVQSFRDLMLEDKTVSEPVNVPVLQRGPAAPIRSPTSPSSAGVISWGLPTSGIQRPRQHSTGSAPAPTCTSPSSPSENPWLGKSPPSGAASFSFSQIVQDERQRHDNLVKNSNKPLSLIQIEERAMQELLQHYGASENLDERITVERVSSTSATPLWDVHKK